MMTVQVILFLCAILYPNYSYKISWLKFNVGNVMVIQAVLKVSSGRSDSSKAHPTVATVESEMKG